MKLRYPNSETLVHAIPDTGAEVNVGGTKLLDQLQLCERDLRDGPYSKLVAANRSLLKKLGTLPITITLNETAIKDDIVICEGQNDLLLSWKTCRDLAIIPDNFPKQIGKINVNPVISKDRRQSSMLKQKLLDEYKEVFHCNNYLPCMNGDPMKIHLQKGATPHAIHGARTIPFAFQEETKKCLQDMVQQGIIDPLADKPTDWCHPIVVVAKPKGGVRICVDLQKLNKQ